jgi:hypothetical protein
MKAPPCSAASTVRETKNQSWSFSIDKDTITKMKCLPGWWFGSFFIFPYIGNNHPYWLLTNIFQRGWNHQPASTSSSHGESNPSSIKSTGGESDACKGGWNLLRQGSGAVWSVVVSWNGYPKMVGLQWG